MKDVLWENVLRSVRRRERKGEERPRGAKDERRYSRGRHRMKAIRFLDSLREFLLILAEISFRRVFASGPSLPPFFRGRDTTSNQDISGFVDKIAHFRVHF